MKLNQQTAALVLCTLLGVSVLAGCGRNGDFPELPPAVNKIEYTNLNDSGSRELLQELLSDAGVSDGRIQGFFRRVDRFHDSVKQEWLTDGFEEAELLYTKYDPYTMQDEWTAKNGMFPGYNCRITAMNLFGVLLSVSADSQINAGEDVLFVDEETLKTDPDALGGSSLADFRALYSSMKGRIPRRLSVMYKPYKRNGHPAALPFVRMKESASSRYSSTISRPRRNLCCLSGMLAHF